MRHFYARGSSQFQNMRPECGCIHFSFEVQNRSRSWEKWETSSLRRDNLLATPPWCLVCGGNNLCGVETLNNWRRELTHTRVVKSKNLPGLSNRPESGPLRYNAIITEWVWVNYNYQHWSVSAINDEPRAPVSTQVNVTRSMSRREFLPSDVLRPGSGSNVIQIGFHIIIINVHPL